MATSNPQTHTSAHAHITQTNSSHGNVPFSQCSLWCKSEETSTLRITVQYAVPSFKAAGLLPVSHAAVQHSWIKQPPAPHRLWLNKLALPSQHQSNYSYISTRAEVIRDDFAGNTIKQHHEYWNIECVFLLAFNFPKEHVIRLVLWYESMLLWDVKCLALKVDESRWLQSGWGMKEKLLGLTIRRSRSRQVEHSFFFRGSST